MQVKDFLARVAAHPHLKLVHHDATMCIIERNGSVPKQTIRIGLWAVRRLRWDDFAEVWGVPDPPAQPPAAMVKRPSASKSS